MIWDTIIVGGGCAGLAAATNLCQKKHKVLVLDRRRVLGGRASSFHDHVSGEDLDNGQHLFMGCYTETKKYLERIGGGSSLRFYPDLTTKLYGPAGEKAELKRASLPAPFNLAWGFLRFGALSPLDRLRMLQVVFDAKRFRGWLRKMTVTEWLNRCGQSARSRERFWGPLTLATINLSMDEAPADLLAVVLRRSFLGSREDAAYGLSSIDLSGLHGEPSLKYLENRGSQLLSRTNVRRLHFDQKDRVRVELHNGRFFEAKTVLCAVPPDALPPLVEGDHRLSSHVRVAKDFQASPILTLHVWCDSEPFRDFMIGFWGQPFQWAFNKKRIGEEGGAFTQYSHISLLISGAKEASRWKRAKLAQEAEKALSLVAGRKIRVLRVVNSVEQEATWLPKNPQDQMARLPAMTPNPRFFLAGDWTDTGLPCTVEGAVFSGHRAARLMDHFLGGRVEEESIEENLPREDLNEAVL